MRDQASHRPEHAEAGALETAPPGSELGWWAGGLGLGARGMRILHMLFIVTRGSGHLCRRSEVAAGFGVRMSRNLTMASGPGSQEQKGPLL